MPHAKCPDYCCKQRCLQVGESRARFWLISGITSFPMIRSALEGSATSHTVRIASDRHRGEDGQTGGIVNSMYERGYILHVTIP